ncbi:MAG: pseudouridine synthase [Cytophagaceae bacterium]|nr:pseudouridine synthase [Cytophagaceae bacterium]
MKGRSSGRPDRFSGKKSPNKDFKSGDKKFSGSRNRNNASDEDKGRPRSFDKKKPFSSKEKNGSSGYKGKKSFSSDPRNKRDDFSSGSKGKSFRSFDDKKSFSDKKFKKTYSEDKRNNPRPFDKKKSLGDKDNKKFSENKKFSRNKDKREDFSTDKKHKSSGTRTYKQYASEGKKRFSEKNKKDNYPSDQKRRSSRSFDNKKDKDFSSDREGKKFSDSSDFKKKGKFSDSLDEKKPFGKKPVKSYDFTADKLQTPPSYNIKRPEGAKKEAPKAEGKIRLNKFIANAGICSRREADRLIELGEVTVNGERITELGYKVDRKDVVKYQNQVIKPEKLIYVLLNKPKDFITTTDDPQERRTVMSLVKNACTERIYPVGRLDRNTTGLLLLTNDGELADKLTHPSNNIKKVYQADLDKPLSEEDYEKIVNGLELEDGPVKVDALAIVSPDAQSIGIEIHEGRNRIVRRIFESLGYQVVKLDRVLYAGLTKKDLSRGKWRYLSEKEIVRLKFFI